MSRDKPGENRNGAAKRPGKPGGRIEIAPRAEIDIATDRLGTVLTERRNTLGLKLEDVAEDIKIRPEYLRALEEETLDALPTPEYGRLFLKSYAERLGIDVSEAYALLDLCERPTGVKPPPEPVAEGMALQRPPARRSFPVVWVSIAVVVVAAVAVWIMLRSGPDAPGTSGADETPDEVASPASEIVAEPEPRQPPEIGEGPMQLAMTFDRETWVVLAADNDTVVNRLLNAGDVVEATAIGFFNLTLGHTDGVAATIDGRRLIPFRERASRLSGIIITADSARAWLDTVTAVTAAPAVQGSDTASGDM